MPEVRTRGEAKAGGLLRYFTGKPCKRGHVAERYVSIGGCVACHKERGASTSHKAYSKAYKKAHYEANSESQKAYKKAWREANADHNKAYSRAWREANPDRARAYERAWREANAERHKASSRAWKQANPDKLRAKDHNRRARKRSAEGSHTAQDIQDIYASQRGFCAYCRVDVGTNYHVDHIQPLSRGGSNGKENLQITCPTCNLKKGVKTHDEFIRELELQEHSEPELEPLPQPLPYQPLV